MRDDDFETSLKIVIVGNGAVGKSSMIQRYCKGMFSVDYKMTIGVDFLERVVRVNGTRVHLMLWDTAGQEEFDGLTRAYYRVSDGCVLAFSTTDRNSFDAVEKWKKKVEYECGSIPMVLVQNKCDLMDQSRVPNDSVERLSKLLNLPVFLTSSKNNVNIDKVFYFLAKACLDSSSTTPESSSLDELDSVASVRPALLNVKYTNPFVKRKKGKSLRQRFTSGERLKSNMIVGISSCRNSPLVQHQPHHHQHHHHLHQFHAQQVPQQHMPIPSSPPPSQYLYPGIQQHQQQRRICLLPQSIHQSTSPVILLHHPLHQQPQHQLRLHPHHHHWSYMQHQQHRKLEFGKKSSPFTSTCWIL